MMIKYIFRCERLSCNARCVNVMLTVMCECNMLTTMNERSVMLTVCTVMFRKDVWKCHILSSFVMNAAKS
jgi:hypothetical protein